ncbi:hypothetical protein BTO06_01330 [Tenacibaculum sp. SZ-18]|uniref:hypothetical protein n=1 Tax=Tenacibaculum sp. SZ-18 TaxID=754423 RepID=UPI000C2CF7CB|nr:hypothetical protein [Tenacibaculum sp. SZ-18]AUC13876.1 hypothetical protein BTO06_01330 [Tenacibaculum sp. SZ-18]
MKKYLLVILSTIVICCKSQNQNYSYEEFLGLSSTHEINNDKLIDALNELIIDNNLFGEFKSKVLVLNVEKQLSKNKICITITDYKVFKNHRPELFEKLKGYTTYNKIPVLLYGKIDHSFFKKTDHHFYDVTGKLPSYNLDNPPIIYDPKIICFEIDN